MKKEINIIIPSSMSEITLSTYLKLRKALGNDEDKLTEYEKFIKIISIACDIDEASVKAMNKNDVEDIVSTITKTLHKTSIFKQRFKLNGVEYGMIPNLDDLSFGEYIDIDSYIKSEETYNRLMSVLFRPITHKSKDMYRIEEYTGNEDYSIMDDCPMDVVNGVMVFFYNLGNDLSKATLSCLHKQTAELEKTIQSKQISGKNGDGTRASMDSLKGTLEDLMKLQS